MLEKVATLYRKAEMGLISGLAGTTAIVIDETRFYDAGYMKTQTTRLQKELDAVTDEWKTMRKDQSDRAKQAQAKLLRKREQLLFYMIFIATNNLNNLDTCMNLAEGHHWEFTECIIGLQEYRSGNSDMAFQHLEAYCVKNENAKEHFLINKVFGLLLTEKYQYQKAIPFLTRALQFVPDDTGCLEHLELCYQKDGNTDRASIVSEILAVLG